MKTEPIKLLWTGGFDSTFRILYILVVEKKHVQPYYIIDLLVDRYKSQEISLNEYLAHLKLLSEQFKDPISVDYEIV